MPITHCATREPEAPEGCWLLPWSRKAWMIIPRPRIPFNVITLSNWDTDASPSAFTRRLPKSPQCRLLSFGSPCGRSRPRGAEKWPPAAEPLSESISPYLWMCQPCWVLGVSSLNFPLTCTRQRPRTQAYWNVARPLAVFPSVGRKLQTSVRRLSQ